MEVELIHLNLSIKYRNRTTEFRFDSIRIFQSIPMTLLHFFTLAESMAYFVNNSWFFLQIAAQQWMCNIKMIVTTMMDPAGVNSTVVNIIPGKVFAVFLLWRFKKLLESIKLINMLFPHCASNSTAAAAPMPSSLSLCFMSTIIVVVFFCIIIIIITSSTDIHQ